MKELDATLFDAKQIKSSKIKRVIKERITIILFLLPALLVYGTYNIYGIFRTFYYSFMKWTGLSPKMTFIGFKNYIDLFTDSNVWFALRNNLILVVVSIVVQISFGLILALIVNSKIKGSKLFRTIYFMPMLLSTVATGIIWLLMFDPYYGLINQVLIKVGFKSLEHMAWIGDYRTAMVAVLFVVCWQYIPQYMILLRAGLTNIAEEINEAATIDGANKFQLFKSITLPLLAPTIKTSAVLSLVGSLKYFDLVYIMTGGGPNGKTEVLATYMYKNGFESSNMGYASSVAAFMFIVSLIMVVIFQIGTRRKEENN
jgi:raffinose/stachyose/melibiose transport system permease protein